MIGTHCLWNKDCTILSSHRLMQEKISPYLALVPHTNRDSAYSESHIVFSHISLLDNCGKCKLWFRMIGMAGPHKRRFGMSSPWELVANINVKILQPIRP